jgi:hypothetical protein
MSPRRNPVRDVIRALAAVEVLREQRRLRSKATLASESPEAAGDWDYARGAMRQRIRRTREARARMHRASRSP